MSAIHDLIGQINDPRLRERLMKALKGRTSLSHVFIVTDSDESFKAMAAEVRETAGRVNPTLQVVQLYRDYLVNFMINQEAAK